MLTIKIEVTIIDTDAGVTLNDSETIKYENGDPIGKMVKAANLRLWIRLDEKADSITSSSPVPPSATPLHKT